MARIETYGNDNKVTGFDKVIGTDVDSGRMTKNYLMRDIREYIFDGASPEVGGKLKITNVAQDTPIPGTETPEALLNNLDPILEVSKYEVLVVSLAFNDSNNEGVLTNSVYLFNKTDIIVGFEQYESTSEDFILLSSSTDNSNIIESIGNEGEDVYDGFSQLDKKHKIRKIKSNNLDVSIDTDSVNIDLDREDLVSDLLINVGTETEEGNEVYKGYDSSAKKHQFRRIISENLTIREEGDNLFIDYVLPDLGGVKEFFVNRAYTGEDEEGSLVKPYKTIDKAIEEFIGEGTIIQPQFLGSRIVVQSNNNQYTFTSDLSIVGLKLEVQEGANIRYKGSEDYMIDFRKILNDSDFVPKNFRVELYGEGVITSDKGIIYAKGSEDTGFIRYNMVIYGGLSFSSYYKINNTDMTTIPVVKGTTTPVIQSQGFDSLFYNGDVMELPAFVCDGDNSISSNISFGSGAIPSFRAGTQVLIYVKNNGYFDAFNADSIRIGYSQNNIGHYSILDSSVQNGQDNVLLPNEDFNFLRLESGDVRINDFLATTAGTRTSITNLFDLGRNSNGDRAVTTIQGGEFFSNAQVSNLISIIENETHIFNNLNITGASPSQFTFIYRGSSFLNETTINNCNISKISDNIDLTRTNRTNVVNRISGRIVESLKKYTSRISAEDPGQNNPVGTKFINTNGNNADKSTWFIDITMQ